MMSSLSPLRKVLIVRFSSLGDIVLTSLAVRCIKKQLNCEVHYLTKKAFNDIVSSNPYIDRVWLMDKALSEVLPALKDEHFDLVIDLHKNLRSRILRMHLWNIPVVSYYKANLEKWLSVYFKMNHFPKAHIALRYIRGLQQYGVQDDGEGLDYFIPQKDQVTQENISKPFIAMVIGAAHYTKRLPLEKLKQLSASLSNTYPVIVIGGKAEYETGKQLESNNVFNTCGSYTINQSASLLAQSILVIAPDTGMMHIAAALKKPIRSIWGSTLSEFGFWPFYGSKHEDLNISFEVKDLSCRPCARFGRDACPKGHFKCMQLQDMELVRKSVIKE
jgi:ADP-heptose:LPS heptosyltransferase